MVHKEKPLNKKEKKEVKTMITKSLNNVVETKQIVRQYTDAVPVGVADGTQYLLNASGGNATADITGATGPYQAIITKIPTEQGVGGYQHIGNKILIKELEFKMHVYQNATGAYNNQVRFMIIHDKKTQGTPLNMAEVLWDATAGNGFASPLKYNSKTTYKVLHDKIYTFKVPAEQVYGGLPYIQIRYKKKFKNGLVTTYYPDTNNTTVTGIQDNAIYAALIADDSNVGASKCFCSMLYQDA